MELRPPGIDDRASRSHPRLARTYFRRSRMSERRFNWGIVGTGGIARQFAADLALLPDTQLALVCSRDGARAAAFAAEFGVARSCAGLDSFFAYPELDAIYVATPSALHADQAVQAIEAGKPVLVEKPIAVSATE